MAKDRKKKASRDSGTSASIGSEQKRSVQGAYTSMARRLWDRVRHSESETLAGVRDVLLPGLLSGEIRVKDAEELAGAAT